MTAPGFKQLRLKNSLFENLASLGYHHMTPIQAKSLPPIIKGKDVIAQGRTGSGKTAAFGLGILERLDVGRFRVQALVLCPTRELADQVAGEVRRLARGVHNVKVLTLCGGAPIGPQLGSLSHGAHIVIGTPGRIEEHLRKKSLSLKDASVLVLDEADRMLDMGFQPILEKIIQRVPKKRQTLLFSATFPDSVQQISERVTRSPIRIVVDSTHDTESITQYVCQVADNRDRIDLIHELLLDRQPDSALVFCNTKREAGEIAAEFRQFGFDAGELHGDLEQREREEALIRFANKSTTVLVATDIAARGLDIDDVDLVLNYQLARDASIHIHRIGRTARAGKQGMAVSLFTEREYRSVASLESELGQVIETLPPLPAQNRNSPAYRSTMVTLQIDVGRKQKIRPGDVLGALTSTGAIGGNDVGKIQISEESAYVAIRRRLARDALNTLSSEKVKGRPVRVRQI